MLDTGHHNYFFWQKNNLSTVCGFGHSGASDHVYESETVRTCQEGASNHQTKTVETSALSVDMKIN